MHETSRKKTDWKRVAGSSVCIPRKANVEENIGCGRERSRKIGERKEKKEEKKKRKKEKERRKKQKNCLGKK